MRESDIFGLMCEAKEHFNGSWLGDCRLRSPLSQPTFSVRMFNWTERTNGWCTSVYVCVYVCVCMYSSAVCMLSHYHWPPSFISWRRFSRKHSFSKKKVQKRNHALFAYLNFSCIFWIVQISTAILISKKSKKNSLCEEIQVHGEQCDGALEMLNFIRTLVALTQAHPYVHLLRWMICMSFERNQSDVARCAVWIAPRNSLCRDSIHKGEEVAVYNPCIYICLSNCWLLSAKSKERAKKINIESHPRPKKPRYGFFFDCGTHRPTETE